MRKVASKLNFKAHVESMTGEEMSGERPVLFKMKELWTYMGDLFEDCDKELKKLRKASEGKSA